MSKPTFIDREFQQLLNKPGVFERMSAVAPKPKVSAPSYRPSEGNPFATGTWNLTRQMQILRSDRGLADRLRAQAERGDVR